jgi:tetratricopeptide (TPR) repeat protein
MSKPSKAQHVAEFQDRLASAQKHRDANEMELARAEYIQALAYAEKHLGAYSAEVDQACYRLASFYAALREPTEELAVLERRLRIRQGNGDVPEIVDALQDVALCHASYDRPTEAEEVYQEAIALCEETDEKHQPILRATLLYYGDFLNEHRRPADAVPVFERGLRLCAHSQSYPSISGSRLAANLARSFFALKRTQEAVALLEHALPVLAHRSQPTTAITRHMLYALAREYHKQKRHAEAEHWYSEAIYQANLSSPARDHAFILEAAADNDQQLGKTARAERRQRKAITQILRVREPHHEDTLGMRQSLVNLLIPAERYAEAETVLTEMVAATDHPDFSDDRGRERYLNNLGFVQVHLEEFPKAEANLRRGLETADDENSAFLIKNLGLMYQKMGYSTEAIHEYQRALALFEKFFDADHKVAVFIRDALKELQG